MFKFQTFLIISLQTESVSDIKQEPVHLYKLNPLKIQTSIRDKRLIAFEGDGHGIRSQRMRYSHARAKAIDVRNARTRVLGSEVLSSVASTGAVRSNKMLLSLQSSIALLVCVQRMRAVNPVLNL